MNFEILWYHVYTMFEFALMTFISILERSTFWTHFLVAFAVCVVVRFLLAPVFSGHAQVSVKGQLKSNPDVKRLES